jgi:hypothetical protein
MKPVFSSQIDLKKYLQQFVYEHSPDLFQHSQRSTTDVEYLEIDERKFPKYINEFWTSKQRQASSLHEVAYRACFKAQLPRFFIHLLTQEKESVYDPFSGRGTTALEAAFLGRNVIANDINPLSKILSAPRINIPENQDLEKRLSNIPFLENAKADIDLSMFYHPKTEAEIVSLRQYLLEKRDLGKEDEIDSWIRMVATNRLTGHSPGFFSVYTLPPNQAISPKRQEKINQKRNQKPEFRDIKKLILKKTRLLLRDIPERKRLELKKVSQKSLFLTNDARSTSEIPDETVQLTVTSPPFLDVVQYANDNWLRCWFNGISTEEITPNITMSKTIEDWVAVMGDVFKELFRITKLGGWVAFEVGEIRSGKINLDECVIPIGIDAGFNCEAILINEQTFTKTSNIWGIKNNERGTNSNRIVIFQKI